MSDGHLVCDRLADLWRPIRPFGARNANAVVRRDGTWERLLAHAQTKSDTGGEVEWLVSVNSNVVGSISTLRGRVAYRGARTQRGVARPKDMTTPVTGVGGEEEIVAGFDRERLTRSLGL